MTHPVFLRTLILAGALLLHLGALSSRSDAAAGDVDLSFDPGSGVNGSVYSVLVQPDGKLIIAGQFTTVRGLLRTNLARLNADGSGDATFHAGTNGSGGIIALQPDGKVLVSGMFTSVCDETWGCFPIESIRRLNADGSLDAGFTPAEIQAFTDMPGCRALAVQPDGRILVGGHFNGVNGTNRPGLARLNADGTLDHSFDPPPASVHRLALQANGDVLIAGGPGGSPFLARLNSSGQPDTNFNPGASLSGSYVSSLAVQPDGRIVLGGSFTSTNANASFSGRSTVRLLANGSLDTSYNAPADPNDGATDVAVQADGKVLVAGASYTTIDGPRRQVLIRLHPNGALDATFNPGPGVTQLTTLVVQPNGLALVGSYSPSLNLTRLNVDGSRDNSFDAGRSLARANPAIALQADGKVLLGGALVEGDPYWGPHSDVLAFVNGTNNYGSARLNANGSSDSSFVVRSFQPPLSAFYHPEDCVGLQNYWCYPGVVISTPLVQQDGKVLLSGYSVTTIIGEETFFQITHSVLARFTPAGSLDSTLDQLTNSYVTAMARQADGKILIAGSLNIDGTYPSFARLNSDGSIDSSFQRSGGSMTSSLAVQPDGKVIVGGSGGLGRLSTTGVREACFNPSVDGTVYSVAVQPDGKILLGGSFTTVNGVSRRGIARVNPDGSLDGGFNPSNGVSGVVGSVVLQPDGNVLISGDFVTVNDVVRPYVARLLGGDTTAPSLRIFAAASNAVVVAWPSAATGFTLQQTTNLTSPAWTAVPTTPAVVALENQVTAQLTNRGFFRLSGTGTGVNPYPIPAPITPRFVTGIAGNAQVTLNWTTYAGATSHRIQRATNNVGPYTTIAHTTSATFTDTNLVNGRPYYYKVATTYPCGVSADSDPAGVTPYPPPPPVFIESITMSWVASSGRFKARAVVKVVTSGGVPVSNVSVTGSFSGAINDGPLSGDFNNAGDAPITSLSRIQNGTVTFTVTGINAYGTKLYTPASNVVTSATITR